MRRELAAGLVAGAAGIVALNAATYADMLGRGRPASTMPADAAEKLTEVADVGLGDEEETAANRREALGAMLGIATGLTVGAFYGFLRRWVHVSLPVAAVGLGAAAMAGSDLPMTALGLTDPREWDAASWAADVLPHLSYGVAAAVAYRLCEA